MLRALRRGAHSNLASPFATRYPRNDQRQTRNRPGTAGRLLFLLRRTSTRAALLVVDFLEIGVDNFVVAAIARPAGARLWPPSLRTGVAAGRALRLVHRFTDLH